MNDCQKTQCKRKQLSFRFDPYFEETFAKEKVLGKGGFGRVWQVLSNGNRFAIKRVRIQGSLCDNLISSQNYSLREALIPSSVSHENIISYFDCWIEHEKPLPGATSRESVTEFRNNCLATVEKTFQDVATQTCHQSHDRKYSEPSTPGLSSIGHDSGVSSVRLMSRLESVAGQTGRRENFDFMRLSSLLDTVPDESSSSRVYETSRFHHSWEPSPASSISENTSVEDYFSDSGATAGWHVVMDTYTSEFQSGSVSHNISVPDERNDFVTSENLDAPSSNENGFQQFSLDTSELSPVLTGDDSYLFPSTSQENNIDSVAEYVDQSRRGTSDACTQVRKSCDASEPSCFVLYIQMPLYDTDLKQYIESRVEASPEENLNLFRQIIQGLVHIHKNEIIHRDIKPANIFLNLETHRLCIGDFGRAVKKADSHETEVGLRMTSNAGTTLYMAPEVQGSSYNEKCDLYSAGIVLFELFTVTITTDEQSRLSDINFLKESRFISTEFREEFPDVAHLILRLTATDPESRPSAVETLEILSRIKSTVNDGDDLTEAIAIGN